MKRNFNHNVFAIIIVIASLFMGIGYSAVNSVILDIKSNVYFLSEKKIMISNVEIFESIYANGTINFYDGTYLDTSVTLSNDINTLDSTYLTLSITVTNNTSDNYGYEGTSFYVGEDTYDNENIIFEIIGITENDEIESGMSKTFLIKFKYDDTNNIVSNILNSKINFKFKNLSGMVLKDLILANEESSNSGLYSYNNKYFFGGANVNNYVWFNCDDGYTNDEEHCEKWRIISIENNGSIKIIKDDVVSLQQITTLENSTDFWYLVTNKDTWVRDSKILAQGKVIYDYKKIRPINTSLENSYCLRDSNGCNAYSSNQNMVGLYENLNVDEDSMIKKYLDTVYYKYGLTKSAKKSIEEYILPIGLVGININLENVINAENSITCNAKVGLLNVSDYIITSNNENCKQDFNRYYNGDCKSNNWLLLTNKQYLLVNGKILASNDKRQQVWTIRSDGAIYSQDATNEYFLRPVVVLRNNIISKGIGTIDDAYTLIS